MAESSSSSTMEADKEELLDRMLTRLALCEDSNLQTLLSKLLTLTLSTLSSPSTSVRNKVLEILSHVNKRVKHQPEIRLPLSELWNLYLDANSNSMVKNFCIVYIEMAFERATPKEKENMSPVLVSNISKLPLQHQEIILRAVSKVIGECHSKQINEEAGAKYKLLNDCRDRDLFVEFCLHLMLYQQPSQGGGCPPGLSLSQTNRIMGKNALNNEDLLMRKLGVLNVIEALELPPELVYPLYLAASADSREAVIKRGEDLLKKKASTANLDDANLVNKLFLLFNGTTGTENVPPESRISPGNVTLRTKLMSIFCRSITAANSFPATLQCIFSCMYGSGTTSRLQQLGMEFTVWVFKHAKTDQLKLMGPVILNGILKLLDAYPPSESDALARTTKSFSYQAIGLLVQRLSHLFRDKIEMVVRLFDALKVEPQSLRLVIQEATNALATAYKGASATVLVELEELLLKNCQAEENEVRFCAVRWATSLFGLQHCPSRFICILGTADSRLDTREMALEGLFPGKNTSQNIDLKYPRLKDMLDYILNQQPKLADSTEMRELKLIFPAKMYMPMINFLLKCFESEIEHDLERSPEFLLEVERMCLLLEHAMAYESSFELHAIASKAIINIGSYFPELIATRYAPRISWLKQFLSHTELDTRESAARLLGIACSAVPADSSSDLLHELSSVSKTNNLRFEAQYGALCAIGYVTADLVSRNPPIPGALFQNILKCLTDVVTSESATLASIAMQALGHIGLRQPLPPLVNDSGSVDLLVVLQEKLSKLLTSDDSKAVQKIVISLGHICSKESSTSLLNIALDLIFSLCRSKVEDALFAAGEALSFLWGGVPVTADLILKTNYSSLSMISNFLLGDMSASLSKYYSVDKSAEANEDYHVTVRDAITRKLFDALLYSSRKEERCAGAVWLLSLTMYCGHHLTIQRMLPEIQEAFSHLLGDQNELTQEMASQGMGIVYELGDASMKKQLVDALVTTLTGSGKRKRAIKLVGDSEVFQEGVIGESLSGGKLTTYKELCNLANEMGQPDLIYKFMDLANHQASLNSKRGAAVGFSKIAQQAGDALQPHLKLLIPRLIRYQYDPDKNVQDAMVHIWRSLVADPKKTIDEHFDLIVEDLVIQCGSRVWRSRESSALALSDIIQGQKFDKVGKHLRSIWVVSFRVMDDMKETVRVAGDRLCRSVTSLTIRLCDTLLTTASDASKTMEIVLPFLLEEGILSKVKSIQKASIDIVMKLAKGAGTALRPHLPDLVCCMLESLSSLEDQGLNYIELHASNAGIQTEKLDNLRVSIAKESPMWETLDLCINVVNTETLGLLVPRLANSVRSGVGLNTRVGVANFISLLVEKVGTDIKPFTSMLLRLMFPVVKEERNAAVKRAFSNACAMVLKHAGSSQAQKLIEDTIALNMGDKNEQISCALLLKSYSYIASDVLSGYQAMVIPIIFNSRFDDDKNLSTLFEELWDDNTSGERVATQLYLVEIVSLVCEGLKSSSWTSKRKSAQAICKLCDVLSESLSSHCHVLLDCLMKELSGRLWEGKEALLNAIGALCLSCHKAIVSENPSAANEILSVMSSACTKKAKKYREAAFSSLDQVIKAFGSPEFFNVVFPLLFEMCNSAAARKTGAALISSDASQAESEEAANASIPMEKVLLCTASCVHVAHLNDLVEQKNLMHILTVPLSPGFQWTVKLSALALIKELCSRLQTTLEESVGTLLDGAVNSSVEELFHSISPKVIESISTIKIGQFHVAASECLLEIIKLYAKQTSATPTEMAFKEELNHLYEVEKNEEAKTYMKKCLDILGDLQHRNSQRT